MAGVVEVARQIARNASTRRLEGGLLRTHAPILLAGEQLAGLAVAAVAVIVNPHVSGASLTPLGSHFIVGLGSPTVDAFGSRPEGILLGANAVSCPLVQDLPTAEWTRVTSPSLCVEESVAGHADSILVEDRRRVRALAHVGNP